MLPQGDPFRRHASISPFPPTSRHAFSLLNNSSPYHTRGYPEHCSHSPHRHRSLFPKPNSNNNSCSRNHTNYLTRSPSPSSSYSENYNHSDRHLDKPTLSLPRLSSPPTSSITITTPRPTAQTLHAHLNPHAAALLVLPLTLTHLVLSLCVRGDVPRTSLHVVVAGNLRISDVVRQVMPRGGKVLGGYGGGGGGGVSWGNVDGDVGIWVRRRGRSGEWDEVGGWASVQDVCSVGGDSHDDNNREVEVRVVVEGEVGSGGDDREGEVESRWGGRIVAQEWEAIGRKWERRG